MPILGFETHRHRKYLSRAFQNVDLQNNTKEESDPNEPLPRRRTLNLRFRRHHQQKLDESDEPSETMLLLRGYLNTEKPVHCRRTLDQFYYNMLKSTESRDRDQVAYRWARKERRYEQAEDRPVLMVDQLWIWALHDGCPNFSYP